MAYLVAHLLCALGTLLDVGLNLGEGDKKKSVIFPCLRLLNRSQLKLGQNDKIVLLF